MILPVIGLRWGMPGKATTTTGPPAAESRAGVARFGKRQLRGRVQGRLLEGAVATEIVGRVEIAGLVEEIVLFKPPLGSVIGIAGAVLGSPSGASTG